MSFACEAEAGDLGAVESKLRLEKARAGPARPGEVGGPVAAARRDLAHEHSSADAVGLHAVGHVVAPGRARRRHAAADDAGVALFPGRRRAGVDAVVVLADAGGAQVAERAVHVDRVLAAREWKRRGHAQPGCRVDHGVRPVVALVLTAWVVLRDERTVAEPLVARERQGALVADAELHEALPADEGQALGEGLRAGRGRRRGVDREHDAQPRAVGELDTRRSPPSRRTTPPHARHAEVDGLRCRTACRVDRRRRSGPRLRGSRPRAGSVGAGRSSTATTRTRMPTQASDRHLRGGGDGTSRPTPRPSHERLDCATHGGRLLGLQAHARAPA